MSASLIEHTPSAYDYPLLIKHLLHTPLATAPEQEIVYRDISRYTYRTLRQRIGRLASGLAGYVVDADPAGTCHLLPLCTNHSAHDANESGEPKY